MKLIKFILVLIWLFLIASQFVPALKHLTYITQPVIIFLAAIHTLEFFIWLPVVKRAEGSVMTHYFYILLFGLFHYLGIKQPRNVDEL